MLLVFVYFPVCSGTASRETKRKERLIRGSVWQTHNHYNHHHHHRSRGSHRKIIILAKVNTRPSQPPTIRQPSGRPSSSPSPLRAMGRKKPLFTPIPRTRYSLNPIPYSSSYLTRNRKYILHQRTAPTPPQAS